MLLVKFGTWQAGVMKYIFRISIKPGHSAEQYANAWVRASELIQKAPGAKGTELHRMIGNPNELLAIAHWESKAARDAMESGKAAAVRDIVNSQAPFVDIQLIGEFADPEWVVRPS